MTRSASWTLTALLAIVSAAPVLAASPAPSPWACHLSSGMRALDGGQELKAERCFQRTLPFAAAGLTSSDLLFRDWTAIAIAYGNRGWYRQAREWGHRAVTGFEELGGPMNLALVGPLLALGSIELAARRYDESAAHLMRAFRIGWMFGRRPPAAVRPVVDNLAAALDRAGRGDRSEHLRQAFAGTEPTPQIFVTAAESEGGQAVTDTPRWDAYVEARDALAAGESAMTFLSRWFARHDDPTVLGRSALVLAKVQSLARRRWAEMEPHIERYGLARFKYELVRDGNEVDEAVVRNEERWLRAFNERLVEAERHYETILLAK